LSLCRLLSPRSVPGRFNDRTTTTAFTELYAWQHITLTYRSVFQHATAERRLFRNGVELALSSDPAVGDFNSPTGSFRLAQSLPTFPGLIGGLDEFKVWKRALTPSELYLEYRGMTVGWEPRRGLLAHWDFEDQSSGTLRDVSGEGNHLLSAGAHQHWSRLSSQVATMPDAPPRPNDWVQTFVRPRVTVAALGAVTNTFVVTGTGVTEAISNKDYCVAMSVHATRIKLMAAVDFAKLTRTPLWLLPSLCLCSLSLLSLCLSLSSPPPPPSGGCSCL
jgi:hypothetical protein